MSRTCQFAFAGRAGAAEWSFDEVSLIVAPADGRPLVFPLQEMAGMAGTGYTLELTVPGPAAPAVTGETGTAGGAGAATTAAAAQAAPPLLSLTKLGAEGPTLLDALQRTWLVARAKALRLGGSGGGKPFSGMVYGIEEAGAGAVQPFRALLFEDVMVVARESRDLDPIFIALTEKISFDDTAYAVPVAEWPGREIVFSKLGKQTEDLLDSLRKRRESLSNESGTTLASTVPSLPSAYRGILAGDWPPGRLRSLQDLNAIGPGFEQAFRTVWLSGCVRKYEGQFLLDWAGPASCWLSCSRETSDAGDERRGRRTPLAPGREEWHVVPGGAHRRGPGHLPLLRRRRDARLGVAPAVRSPVLQGGLVRGSRDAHRRTSRSRYRRSVPWLSCRPAGALQGPRDPHQPRKLAEGHGGCRRQVTGAPHSCPVTLRAGGEYGSTHHAGR
jgi:hypothetical protein